VVSGFFDPLVVSHAERLQQLKGPRAPLLVLIAEPENAILPARARAELVAGLRVVDYVCESPDGVAAQVQLEEEHRRGLEELIGQVHARSNKTS
jgi:hypothetical protein